MPQVFMSHCSKDKRLVLDTADYLSRSLINVWVDDNEIPGGHTLSNAIAAGIHKCPYFLAFISNDYLTSNWCLDEFDQAYDMHKEQKITIIPVLVPNRGTLDFTSIPYNKQILLESFLNRTKYVEYDTYNPNMSIKRVAKAIWDNEDIKFDPIQQEIIDGIELQVIYLQKLEKILPTSYLQTWDVNLMDFIAESISDTRRPIKPDIPVAINGGAPNWLIAYLTIPLKNQRSVYVYNNVSSEYICVFAKGDQMIGKVLKPGK